MKYLPLLFLCLLIAACTPPGGEQVPLDGTRWTLRSMNGHSLQPGTVITLRFDAERMYGRGGCNNYGGEYSLGPGDGFTAGEGGWTEMGCLEPTGVMEQEAEYTDSLWKVNAYRVEGSRLSLMNEREGILLQYQRLPRFDVLPADLTGKSWQLVSAPGLLGPELEAVILWFDVDRFEGTTLCRDYEGTYRTEADSLFVSSMQMDGEPECSERALRAEGIYTSLLSTAWQYNVTETELELYTDRGETLVFELSRAPTRTPAPTLTPSATPPTTPTGALPPTPTPTQSLAYP